VDNKQVSQVTTGTIIILVGLILLSGQYRGGLDFGRLWPLVFIVLGVTSYLRIGDDGRRGNGGWFLFLGALFLLNNYTAFRIRDSWPLFIVAAGVATVFGRKDDRAKRRARERDAVTTGQSGQPGGGVQL
jgi:hypothetical protein